MIGSDATSGAPDSTPMATGSDHQRMYVAATLFHWSLIGKPIVSLVNQIESVGTSGMK
jgi:hypothetical protein